MSVELESVTCYQTLHLSVSFLCIASTGSDSTTCLNQASQWVPPTSGRSISFVKGLHVGYKACPERSQKRVPR